MVGSEGMLGLQVVLAVDSVPLQRASVVPDRPGGSPPSPSIVNWAAAAHFVEASIVTCK